MTLTPVATRAAEWRAIERRRALPYVQTARLFATAFRSEGLTVADAFAQSGTPDYGMIAVNEVVKGNRPAWERLYFERYASIGRDFAKSAYLAVQGKRGRTRIDVRADMPLDAWLDQIRRYVQETSGAKITNVSGTTIDRVRGVVQVGMEAGESMADIAKRIQTLYSGFSGPRAMVIARTEVIAASGAGGRAGALATELDLEHEWLDTADGRTRHTHSIAGGQRKPMREPYTVGGYKLMFPGDSSMGAAASEIVQCRCAETFWPV